MKTIEYRGYKITYWAKPIPDRKYDYDFVHDDYDGAEDSNDNRCGSGESITDCARKIDEYWEDHYSALNEEIHLKSC